MKVVFHFNAGPALIARLANLDGDGLNVTVCPENDERRFTALMAQAEVLWHILTPVTSAVIEAAPRLRLIQKIGVGVNTIDVEAARARNIAVCNLPNTNARAVAELTLLLMLAALRRLATLDAAVRVGKGWSLDPAMQDHLSELGGRTVGLIGYGAIPRLLVPVLLAMGCRVIYTTRTPCVDPHIDYCSLDDLLTKSDVVSLHVPLTTQTKLLIDAKALARMRRGSVLINTARGGLVDQAALADALTSGHLLAAGLDVFAHEPVDPSDVLFSLENVVLTPHIAWLTSDTFERSLAPAVENCRRLRDGSDLLFRIA